MLNNTTPHYLALHQVVVVDSFAVDLVEGVVADLVAPLQVEVEVAAIAAIYFAVVAEQFVMEVMVAFAASQILD